MLHGVVVLNVVMLKVLQQVPRSMSASCHAGAEALVPAKNRQALYAASRQLMHAAKQRSKHFPEGGDAEQGVPLLNGSPAAQVQVPAHQKAVKVKQAGSRQKGLKRKLEAEAEVGPGELEASGEGPGSTAGCP